MARNEQLPWDLSQYDPDDPDGSRRKTKQGKGKKKKVKRVQIIPTGTALLARVPVFLPRRFTLRAEPCKRRYKTAWGRVTIIGPQLTQAHRDLVEALLVLRGKDKATSVVFYTMSDLRRALGRRRISHKYRKRILEDLSDAKIRLKGTDKNGEVVFEAKLGIVDSFAIRKRKPKVKLFGRKKPPVADPEQRYCVRLSDEFLALFATDIAISYPAHVPTICRARHAVTKAIGRFMLSHSHKARYSEATLRNIIKAKGPKDVTLTHKALIDDAEVLKAIGIEHDPEKRLLTYRQDKGRVFIQRPLNKEIGN